MYNNYTHNNYHQFCIVSQGRKKNVARQGLEPRVFRLPCVHSTTELPSHTKLIFNHFHVFTLPHNFGYSQVIACWERINSFSGSGVVRLWEITHTSMMVNDLSCTIYL